MKIISDILFIVSNGLFVPVLLLLVFFLIKGLIIIVNLFPDIVRHNKERRKVGSILDHISMDDNGWLEEIMTIEESAFKATLSDIVTHIDDAPYCERRIANYEIEIKTSLSKSRALIKFGPMLGLMGTLIPMGPALVGLASGDLSTMAYNMQVAFATTVVGMVIAAIGVLSLQVNRHYYSYTFNDLEYIYSRLSTINLTKSDPVPILKTLSR